VHFPSSKIQSSTAFVEAEPLRWSAIPLLTVALLLVGLIAHWSWELMGLERLRRDGRTALAIADKVENAGQSHLERPASWVAYHFVPRDSETRYEGHDLIDSRGAASAAEAATPRPIHVKYLPDDPSFNRVADTIVDRVVSTRVAIVLTGTAAVLLAGCGFGVATMNRESLAMWWSGHLPGS
jgi:hypothetical protein